MNFFSRILRLLLNPLAWIYGAGVWLRNWAYDWGLLKTTKLPVRVVAVGNLSTGGTGKTPMAEALIRTIVKQGLRPGYLSRGYGRKTRGFVLVDVDEHTYREVGDEALQVATKFPDVPVAVCENRVAGARELLRQAPIDVLVLDDAFQHRRIGRDLDIVMIDANRPPWKDALLPVGHLREPRANIARADLVVVNKLPSPKHIPRFKHRIEQPTVFAQLTPSQIVSVDGTDRRPISTLHGKNVMAFAGLGNNEDFFDGLKSYGMRLVEAEGFADHHAYTADEIKRIARRYRKLVRQDVFSEELLLLTTEKDATRLMGEPWFQLQLAQLPLYYLEIELDVYEGKDIFDQQLIELVGRHAGTRSAAV